MLAFAATASGQPAWPRPAKRPETPVACTNCAGHPAGGLTVGYRGPIVSFAGRFLDSSNVRDYQATFRTARAWSVTVNEKTNRIYFRIGSSVFAYDLATFFQRLEANEPLMYSTQFPVNPSNTRVGGTEVFLKWDEYFYPEYNKDAGWKTIKIDRQEFIESFDVDNEGYVYIPAEQLGWGIVKDSGARSGGLMVSQFQRFLTSGDPVPYRIVAVKASGNRMIAIVSGPTTDSDVWDVTNRTAPVKIADRMEAVRSFAKNSGGDVAAMVDWSSTLRIMTGDQLAASRTPAFQGHNYVRVTSDGTNFFALKITPQGGRIAVLIPSGSTYVELHTHPVDPTFQVTLDTKISYGGGYLFLAGADTSYVWDARLYQVNNLVPKLQPVLAHPTGTSYFKAYYAQSAGGYIAPAGPYINMVDGTAVQINGKTYLIVCAKGLGDVYQIGGAVSSPPQAAPPADEPANGCRRMDHTSWRIVYEGSTSRCLTGMPCFNGEQITYGAETPLNGVYDASCSLHTFTWTFPDGTTATGNPVAATFNGEGPVYVRVENAAGGSHDYMVYMSREITPPPAAPPADTPPPPPPGARRRAT